MSEADLRGDYEKGRSRTAIQRLHKRHMVVVDNELVYEKDDRGLAWGARDHFLDYYLLIPASCGLQAILPTS